jgi:hypothetical protein
VGRGRQAVQTGQGGRSRSVAAGPSALARLGKRFARFRLEHPRGTRYPDELRQAALALLGEVEPDALYRTCGVSFRQVMAWKAACRPAGERAVEFEPPGVRVFSVVDEEPVACAELPTVRAAETGVELRLGQWTVIVRVEGGQSAAGGRACCP